MSDLERAVRNGSTLQWFDKQSGEWLTPRDRETMLRILREDATRQYRLRPVIAAGVEGSDSRTPGNEKGGIDAV